MASSSEGDTETMITSGQLSRLLFRRLLPILFGAYVLSYIDRSNVGFAALKMNSALGFSPSVYGTGAAIFFIGYVLGAFPLNLLTLRIGPRLSITAMMLAWGAVAMAMALTRDAPSFYGLRFLLGLAEAGFAPAMIMYVRSWFPERSRATAMAAVATAILLAQVIGAPLSAALLGLPDWLGLASWQWLFVIEGLPTILFAVVVFRFLDNRPAEATWLSDGQRRALLDALADERRRTGDTTLTGGWQAACDWRVWLLAGAYACFGSAALSMLLWLPQIIRQLQDMPLFTIGLVTALPHLLGAIANIWGGIHSDGTGRRYPYVIGGALSGALALILSGLLAAHPLLAIAALTLGGFGLHVLIGPFLTIASGALEGRAMAIGMAIITGGGSAGGFVGTLLLGLLRERAGDFTTGLLAIASLLILGAGIMVALARRLAPPPVIEPAAQGRC